LRSGMAAAKAVARPAVSGAAAAPAGGAVVAVAVAPVLRGLLSRDRRVVMTFDDSPDVLEFAASKEARALCDLRLECAALNAMSDAHFYGHNIDAMSRTASESLAIAERLESPVLRARAMADLADRARRVGERIGADGEALRREPPQGWVVATVEEAAERFGARRDAGLHRVMCQLLVHDDLDAVALIGGQLAPMLA